jgi:hypothetical protein
MSETLPKRRLASDEAVTRVIGMLPEASQLFARAQWEALAAGTRLPSPDEFGLTSIDAQEVRIKLAGL